MCTTKAPKAQSGSADAAKKPVQYMTNPWLDGLGVVGADARGRNSLRIDRGTPRVPINTGTPPPVTTNWPPAFGGGGGGGGIGGFGRGLGLTGAGGGRVTKQSL